MKFYPTYDNDMFGYFFRFIQIVHIAYNILIYYIIINYTFETGLMCMFWPFRSYTRALRTITRHAIKIIAQHTSLAF